MDLEQRLSHLENHHDWNGIVETIEQVIETAPDSDTKANLHLRLGRVLQSEFLQGVKALKHFQDAYKLSPALVSALHEARAIYWEIGKLNMVQKLLEIELRSASDAAQVARLSQELGDVLCDLEAYDKAEAAYARAVESGGANKRQAKEFKELLGDLRVDAESWQERIAQLLRSAHGSSDGAIKAHYLLRASRLAKRFAPQEVEGMLSQAYLAQHDNTAVAALLESHLVENQRTDAIVQLQQSVLESLSNAEERVSALLRFGTRWALRHQNPEVAGQYLEIALRQDPRCIAALNYLREHAEVREGGYEGVLALADALLEEGVSERTRDVCAVAGLIAWKDMADIGRARRYYESLARVDADHPSLKQFEMQLGTSLVESASSTGSSSGADDELAAAASGAKDRPRSKAPRGKSSSESTPPGAKSVHDAGSAIPSATAEAAAEVSDGGDEQMPQPTEDANAIRELKEQLRVQEEAKRQHDVVKTLVALAEAVADPAEKVDFLLRAADLYVTRFANQAEAARAYEGVIQHDPMNVVALDFLRQVYERRREWEKLIALDLSQAERVEAGPERTAMFKDIAKLATERVKKPDVCIELWNQVLEGDPNDLEALRALSQMHERARDFEKLAGILETLAEASNDTHEKIQLLTKLGQIVGDRLNDDLRAMEAYRSLLELVPDDRRAQEQLKRRYVALGRWDDLELFYANSGKWDEFIRVLETNEARTEDVQQRISMLMKIAELWITQKGKSDRAARAYEKILQLDSENLEAAEQLIPIYSDSSNPRGLAGVIEVKLGHCTTDEERLQLLRDAASLYESRLHDKTKAFERFREAFLVAPLQEESQIDLERTAGNTDQWQEAVSCYRNAIDKVADAGSGYDAMALRLRLGRILVDELNRVDEALTEYRLVYDDDPSNVVALDALEGLYKKAEKWQELLDVYRRKLELLEVGDDRKGVLYDIARIYESYLQDQQAAVESYREVLEEDPIDLTALEALDRLYGQTEDWEAYAEILRRRIDLDVEESVLVDLKFRLAGVLLKQPDGEAEALLNYREILFIDSEHEGTRLALESLLQHPNLRAEAAAILEAIYESREDWEKLITTLEISASVSEEPFRRVELLRKMAGIAAMRLGQLERAFQAQARALREDPSEDDCRIELEDYAERAEAYDGLAEVYQEIAKSISDPRLARDYWLRLAAIHEQRSRVEEAAAGYTKVLEIDGADAEALAALDSLYRRSEHWSELVGVYRRRLELVQDAHESEELYSQMAQVYEERLGKPQEAIAAYREVLALEPLSRTALGALDGLFSRQRMWPELAENLEAQFDLAESDDEQIGVMLRLATLRESEMGQLEAAIDGYRQVLERDPGNRDALAALERLGQEGEFELPIAEILEPLYRQQGDFRKLIGVYEVQVRRADGISRKVDLLHEIAALHEDAGGDANAAFDTLARALAIDPESEMSEQALQRLAQTTGRFADLAKVFEELAQSQQDPEVAGRLTAAAARIFENDVQDIDRAIELYRKVLSIDPTDLAAAQALQMLFQATERFADMSLILQRKAEILDLVDDQKAALYEAARIEEEVLERRENAIGVYQKILELDSEDVRSVDALITLYLGLARWEELLESYSRKADLVVDPQEKKLIFYQVGAVFERELGDVLRAIDTYQRVLELDPDDIEALGRLDVLYQTAENWQELLSVLSREAELTPDAAEAVGFQYRIAELYEKKLADLDRAVELYREILDIQPDHAPTLEALEGIKQGTGAPLAAASVLEPVYEASGEWQKLIDVLRVQVEHNDEVYIKSELLHRIALLCEESLADHVGAFETYGRAVSVDSSNEQSLASFERLASVTDRWPAVAALYDQELEKLTAEPDRFIELALRVAQIYETQLENVNQAISRYRQVLELDGQNLGAVRALDRLFTDTERWSELANILASEAEIADTPDEILGLKFRLGQVYQTCLGELDKAIDAYREVMSAAPEHLETLRALEGLFESHTKQSEVSAILEPIYQASGEWEKLMRVHEAQLEHTTEASERAAMYYRVAEDAEERLLDPVMAFGVYARAIVEQPLDERSSEEAERLAALIDEGWERLANTYADVLSGQDVSADVQAAVGKRLARVFEEELQDLQKAEETYRYVLTVVDGDQESLANLDRIYSSTQQWAELAGVLERRAVLSVDDIEKVELCSRLGKVYEEQLVQTSDAIRIFRRIFDDLEPSNEAAIAALGRIYSATSQWEELMAVYERELETVVGDVQEAEIRARMARLLAGELGRTDEAIEGWKRVLDLRGEDAEALWALADLYQQQQQWAELTGVLERHFDIAESDEERVSILTRRARLFSEQLHRDDEALETWNRLLDIDFSNVTALRELASIWRAREDARELVSALHAMIDRAASLLETDEIVGIYRELGKTYGTVLDQAFEAAEAWQNLLRVDPLDFEAMNELERIYRTEERWIEVIGTKMQRATALPSDEEKIRELLEVTDLWRKEVNDYDRATEAYERILTIDPKHTEAFEALERLHSAAGRWEPVIELYLNRLETREDVSQRSELLRKIARVFEERLDDNNQAFDALVNAFSDDFGDEETARYLERLAHATNRWGELLATANAWLPEQSEPRDKIQLCLRLGKWYGQDLGHPEWAQPYYAEIMQLDPNNVQVLRQMAAIHRVSANWQKVGETLQRALDVAVSNEDRKVILVDMGELLERHMGQVEAGISFFRRALEVDPLYLPALEALERIFEAQNEAAQLVEILAAKVRAVTDSDVIAKHKLRMAQVYETALRDPEKSGRMYRETLEIDGGNLVALRGLERIDELTQNWQDLVHVLERQLEFVETERERVEVLLKLSSVLEEQFLKPEQATQRLEAALEIDPGEERAYVALERCYRRLKQWLDLIAAFERHINEVATQQTKVELYAQIAEVYAEEVGDVERAIDAYQNIVDLDDTNVPALEALARLYEKQDDASRAIDAMTRVAELTTDGTQRVEMYYRIGNALEQKLGDRIQAQERLEMALDLDPSHIPTLAALRAIAAEEGDWERAARYIDQEQLNTQAPRARAKLLVELGRLRDEMLSEHDLAVQAYELAMQSDEDCEEAALPLVEEYARSERWGDAEPLAEMLVRKAKNKDRHEQHVLFRLLGTVHAALRNHEQALKAYQTAHQLDLTDQETIRGIADVAFELHDWPTALTNYQKVLTSLGEDEVERRTDTYYRLGCIKREQGQARQAINNFEKALALNSDHRATLDSLVDVYSKNNDWKQVAAYKRQILDTVYDAKPRLTLLVEIGEVWADKEKNWSKAIEALEEALELSPNDHVILHRLLQLYQQAGDWQKMIDTLYQIAEIEPRAEIRARYVYTQAQLHRDKLNDLDRAVELFNEALDLNPAYLEAFERINKILTQEKNWPQLERAYRKMIHRVVNKGNTDLEHHLWHQLGLIYRDRMQQLEQAIDAFRMAATLHADALVERQILAELYETTERWDEAIAEQRAILASDPLKVDVYRSLYRLFLFKRAYDEAWCVAAAIAFLGEANEEESQFYSDYRPDGMLAVRGRLANDNWVRQLLHEDADEAVSKIFEMLVPAALQAKSAELKSVGKLPSLDARFKQDPATSTVTFAKTFGWAAQVLGVMCPDLYVRSDVPGTILPVPTTPPCSVAGQTVVSGFQPQELAFICAKHLASYRPEAYIRNLFGTQSELTMIFFAGVMLAAPNTPLPPEIAKNVSVSAQALRRYMQPVEYEHLCAAVKQWMNAGSTANLRRWMQAIELTAARAGLLVCGDLEIAKRILGSEQILPGDLTPAEKIASLLLFSVSEQYATLRRTLGIGIPVEE